MRPGIVTIVLIAVLAGSIWGPGLGGSPDFGKVLPAAASESYAGPPVQHSQAPVAGEEELGPVYMYGELMKQPYVFTNVGGDTLYLNGLPYYPMRQPAWRPPAGMSEEQLQAIRDRAKIRFALVDSVSKIVHAMHDSGATYEECLDAYVNLYSASPLVRSVRKGKTWITITWTDGMEEVGIINFEPVPPLPTKEEIHKDQMEDFWRRLRAARMIALGYARDRTYYFTAVKPDMEKMNRLINRLAAGDTLSNEDVIGTPLADKLFRADVARHAARSKAKEER